MLILLLDIQFRLKNYSKAFPFLKITCKKPVTVNWPHTWLAFVLLKLTLHCHLKDESGHLVQAVLQLSSDLGRAGTGFQEDGSDFPVSSCTGLPGREGVSWVFISSA